MGCVELDQESAHCLAGSIRGLEVTNSSLLEGAAAAGPSPSATISTSPPKQHNHRPHTGMSLSLHPNSTTIVHTQVCHCPSSQTAQPSSTNRYVIVPPPKQHNHRPHTGMSLSLHPSSTTIVHTQVCHCLSTQAAQPTSTNRYVIDSCTHLLVFVSLPKGHTDI